MKERLSEDEYMVLANEIKTMQDNYWRVFRMMTGRFPKSERTIQNLIALNVALMKLDYQVEHEFFQDFPEKNLRDYRKENY